MAGSVALALPYKLTGAKIFIRRIVLAKTSSLISYLTDHAGQMPIILPEISQDVNQLLYAIFILDDGSIFPVHHEVYKDADYYEKNKIVDVRTRE